MILELTLSATLWSQRVLPSIRSAGCLTHPPNVSIARQTEKTITIELTVSEWQRLCVESVLSSLNILTNKEP